MPTTRKCNRCGLVLAGSDKKTAKLLERNARARTVEVCRECWWWLIAHGAERKTRGQEWTCLTVPIEQRDIFEDELRPIHVEPLAEGG